MSTGTSGVTLGVFVRLMLKRGSSIFTRSFPLYLDFSSVE